MAETAAVATPSLDASTEGANSLKAKLLAKKAMKSVGQETTPVLAITPKPILAATPAPLELASPAAT